jgi:hypothetical protein
LTAGTDLGYSFHIESHLALLPQPADAELAERVLDAIVVPTIRPQSLRTAAVLANDIGCSLVVLCSTPEQAGQASVACGAPAEDILVTWLPPSIEDNWLSFLTSVHPENIAARLLVQEGPVVGGARMSLAAARKRLGAISPLACSSFIHAWRTDVGAWRHTLLGLPVLGDLAGAARYIGLPAQMGCEK